MMKKIARIALTTLVAVTFPLWVIPALLYKVAEEIVTDWSN